MIPTDIVLANRWLAQLSNVTGVRAPLLAIGMCRDGQMAEYAPKTHTILVSGWLGRRDLIDSLTHEFQHHMDEIVGQPAGGQPRGRHDDDFYERLMELRIRAGLVV